MPKIISGANSLHLARKISGLTKIPIISKVVRKFPDGETYVRLESSDFDGDKVFIIHTLYPEQDENLIELFLTLDVVKEKGGSPYLIIPYMAYGRQDRIFQNGEAFSLKTIAKILRFLGAQGLITVDAHFLRKAGIYSIFGLPARNVSSVTLQFEHARKVIGGEFTVAGPDSGSKYFLSSIEGAVFLGKEKHCPACKMPATGCRCKRKEKAYANKIEVPEKLKNRNVLLLDDMITTGSTIIEAAKALKAKRNRVFVGCTHGLFVGDSLQKLREYADYVFCTDTVKSEASKISVAGLLSEQMIKEAGLIR